MEEYITVKRAAEESFEEKKSVFIGNISPVTSESEAVAFVNSIKKKYPDAKHNVYAYVLRENSIMRYSDDREPQGTAGLPVLDVLRKSGVCDVAIVVTRYFGGILLGTGGLVRAYTNAAKLALDSAEPCKLETYVEYQITCSYSDYQKILQILNENSVRIDSTDFSDSVCVCISYPKKQGVTLLDELTEITAGKCDIRKKGEKFDFSAI